MGRGSLLKSLCLTAVVLGTLATPVAAQVIRIHKGVVIVPLFPPAEVDISGTGGFRVDGAGIGFGFNAITQCSEPGGCPPGAVVELDAEIAGSNFNGTVRLQGTTYVDVGSLSSRENLVLSFAGQATMPPMGGGPTTITAPFELTGEFVYTDDSEVHSPALTGEGIVTLFLEPSLDGTSWMITSAEFDFGPVRRRGSLVS